MTKVKQGFFDLRPCAGSAGDGCTLERVVVLVCVCHSCMLPSLKHSSHVAMLDRCGQLSSILEHLSDVVSGLLLDLIHYKQLSTYNRFQVRSQVALPQMNRPPMGDYGVMYPSVQLKFSVVFHTLEQCHAMSSTFMVHAWRQRGGLNKEQATFGSSATKLILAPLDLP